MFQTSKPSVRPGKDHWRYEKVEPKTSFKALIAGPMVGVDCHWTTGTKPCVAAVTGGKLACPLCGPKYPLRWMGYLPLYDQFNSQIVVGFKAQQGEKLLTMPLHQPIEIWRGKLKTFPILFKLIDMDDWHYEPPKAKRQPVDIMPWLLTLWRDVELTAWVTENPYTAPSMPTMKRKEAPQERPDDFEEVKRILNEGRKQRKSEQKTDPQLNGTH